MASDAIPGGAKSHILAIFWPIGSVLGSAGTREAENRSVDIDFMRLSVWKARVAELNGEILGKAKTQASLTRSVARSVAV